MDFGHVGDILKIDARLLTVLLDHGYLPVISSLGADAEGKVFNINADTVASEIAIQLQAEKLVLLVRCRWDLPACWRAGDEAFALDRG